jgi:hypothetical protein
MTVDKLRDVPAFPIYPLAAGGAPAVLRLENLDCPLRHPRPSWKRESTCNEWNTCRSLTHDVLALLGIGWKLGIKLHALWWKAGSR